MKEIKQPDGDSTSHAFANRKAVPGMARDVSITTKDSAQASSDAGKTNKLRCMYRRTDLPLVLRLSLDQIDDLVTTCQLTSIMICGAERFDPKEVSALLDACTLALSFTREQDRLSSIPPGRARSAESTWR
jgi:hypothetical protein